MKDAMYCCSTTRHLAVARVANESELRAEGLSNSPIATAIFVVLLPLLPQQLQCNQVCCVRAVSCVAPRSSKIEGQLDLLDPPSFPVG